MRLALTEDWPAVFAYNPAALAELPDSGLPAAARCMFLSLLHQARGRALSARCPKPPGRCAAISIPKPAAAASNKPWPCTPGTRGHHLAHIVNCRQRHWWQIEQRRPDNSCWYFASRIIVSACSPFAPRLGRRIRNRARPRRELADHLAGTFPTNTSPP